MGVLVVERRAEGEHVDPPPLQQRSGLLDEESMELVARAGLEPVATDLDDRHAAGTVARAARSVEAPDM
jgi:hypothetical protein